MFNKKNIILFFILSVPLQAQDTIRVIHKNYQSVFSIGKHYPILVEWWVTRDNLSCMSPTKRTDKFLPDPLLRKETQLEQSYINSGFDRGHLSPAADNACGGSSVMNESFYFTNMAPQYPALNRGQWKNLEDWVRHLARQNDSIFVQAGCVGESRRIGIVAVPTHCWKVFKVNSTGEVSAYVFPNSPQRSASFEMHMVTLDSIQKLRK